MGTVVTKVAYIVEQLACSKIQWITGIQQSPVANVCMSLLLNRAPMHNSPTHHNYMYYYTMVKYSDAECAVVMLGVSMHGGFI